MENDLIRRSDALKELWYPFDFTRTEIDINIKRIHAVDAVEVVTCGKCKYGKYTGTEWFCDLHSGHANKFGEDASYHEYHGKHWYCADGQRREDGDGDV